MDLIPGSGRSSKERNDKPLQYSLDHSPQVAKCWTQLKRLNESMCIQTHISIHTQKRPWLQTTLDLFDRNVCIFYLLIMESKRPLCCPAQSSFELVSFVLQMAHFSECLAVCIQLKVGKSPEYTKMYSYTSPEYSSWYGSRSVLE